MKLYFVFITIVLFAVYEDSPLPHWMDTIGQSILTCFEWVAEKTD